MRPCQLTTSAAPVLSLALLLLAEPLPARGVEPRGSWDATLLEGRSYIASLRAARQRLRRQPGLVKLRPDVPTLLIPDLHGQRDYLDDVLSTRDPSSGKTYLQLLRCGEVQVVLLGDVMHTERRRALWSRSGMPEAVMRKEMAESLGTLKRVAELKAECPENFHLLRGNHDDVGPCRGTACRLPLQVARTREYLGGTLGQPLVRELARFFSALPTAAVGSGFVASHAAPMFPVTRAEVVRGSDRAKASLARARVPSFDKLRACASREGHASGALAQVARALGADPQRDCYIHGHLWATPMAVNGPEVFFGHPRDRTFLRLDPGQPVQPWNQLFEAVTGRRVPVPTAAEPR